MTGLWFRVKRDGRWINLELEYCTPYERKELLKDRDAEYLMAVIEIMSASLHRTDELLKELERDGVIERESDE